MVWVGTDHVVLQFILPLIINQAIAAGPKKRKHAPNGKGLIAKTSAPSNPEARAKLEEAATAIEDAKIKNKEAAKVFVREKAALKPYNRSRLTTLEPMLKGWGAEVLEKANKMVVKASALLKLIRDEQGLTQNSSSGRATLIFRLEALTKLIGEDIATGAESRDKMDAWLRKATVNEAIQKGAKKEEPHKKYGEASNLPRVQGVIGQV